MNANKPNLTLDELLPQLRDIENAPEGICRAAYNRLDTYWRGDTISFFQEIAERAQSTRGILEAMWPGMIPQIEKNKPEHYQTLMFGLEHMRRLSNTR